ncbi:MAG: ATP--guanido phosphotransferase [Clostridia bacterium]|nr:ATP--guanido phosphotransferase [Clostridia bacterium]MBQ8973637.1 ATP--guanido phosphotransferase [Clostridia bacterium]
MSDYVQAPEQDVVISSRVRLSRNYDDLPFSPKLTREYAEEVIDRTADAVFNGKNGDAYTLFRMSDMEQDARARLVEHHLISYDLLKYVNRSAAMISSAGTITVMLNEEDHVRFQGMLPGLQLERSADMAIRLDDQVSAQYPFAFDSQLGYLTAYPANVGTGMRCSVVMHLPALASAGQIGTVMQAVAKLGLTIRGLYGDGSEARGHLYQVSNQATLGRSEEDVVHSLAAAVEQIVEHERTMRENAEKKDMLSLQDRLLRSWGELMYARIMPIDEFMRRYSDIRYAASMGYLHAPLPGLDVIMMDVQPGSLGVRAGKLIGEREAEILRAKTLREELGKLVMD